VLATSGSASGTPKRVLIPLDALRASAEATAERLGRPGRWVSCLPAQFVGGFQVLFRSALAGIEPLFLAPGRGLPESLAGLAGAAPGARPTYISLVPAQLRAALSHPGAREALARFGAVLIGGDSLDAGLRTEAEAAGVAVVSTYGMTETCGGCVYDGVPLRGVRVRVRDDGRVLLAGPQLVAGYLDPAPRPDAPARLASDQPFEVTGGVRWLVTGDVGNWDGHRLVVSGRADDVIVTGGRNVSPAEVEDALRRVAGGVLRGVDWAVSGVPDPTWGSVLVLALAGRRQTAGQELLDAFAAMPSHLRPRRVIELDALPRTDSGKLNRRLLAVECAAAQGV
jgi:O-succinylbenzoic acid--CoA ligase